VLPWAYGGDLEDFWDNHGTVQRSPGLYLWSFRQMLGLVDALKTLHDDKIRHGDIRTRNILHFGTSSHPDSGGLGTLVITGFGIAREHGEATLLRGASTTTRAVTMTYCAPEVELDTNRSRSRSYATWSTGCLFLEFMVWLQYGRLGLNNFRMNLQALSGAEWSRSYHSIAAGGRAKIRRPVVAAMRALGDDPLCKASTGIQDFLRLINEDLLRININERASVHEVYQKLRLIVEKLERHHDYLLNEDRPAAIPQIFSSAEPDLEAHTQDTKLTSSTVNETTDSS